MISYETPTVTLLGRIESRATSGFTVTSVSGWALRIDRTANGTFNAFLINPYGPAPYESYFRKTAEEAVERACSYLGDCIGRAEAATALRTMATAEIAATRTGAIR